MSKSQIYDILHVMVFAARLEKLKKINYNYLGIYFQPETQKIENTE